MFTKLIWWTIYASNIQPLLLVKTNHMIYMPCPWPLKVRYISWLSKFLITPPYLITEETHYLKKKKPFTARVFFKEFLDFWGYLPIRIEWFNKKKYENVL